MGVAVPNVPGVNRLVDARARKVACMCSDSHVDVDSIDVEEEEVDWTDEPRDPVQSALDAVFSRLSGLQADPVQRWRDITQFRLQLADVLEQARWVVVGQMMAQLRQTAGTDDTPPGAVADIARQLGVSRSRVYELSNVDLDKAPKSKHVGYRYGALFGSWDEVTDRFGHMSPSLSGTAGYRRKLFDSMSFRANLQQVTAKRDVWLRGFHNQALKNLVTRELSLLAADIDADELPVDGQGSLTFRERMHTGFYLGRVGISRVLDDALKRRGGDSHTT